MLEKKDLKFILILFILNCIFFYKVILNLDGIFYPAMDLLKYYSPMEYFISHSYQVFGQLPLWNPHILSGVPFAGHPENLAFYPLNALFLFFQSDSLFGIMAMVHVLMAGIFTYLFMKLIKASRFASFISALIFMFSGVFAVRFSVGLYANGILVSYVPVIFFCAELLLQKREVKYAFFLSVALTLAFLIGHTQNFISLNICLLIYILCRLAFIIKEKKKDRTKTTFTSLRYFAYAFLIFILLSSIYLLPTIQTFQHMTRSKGVKFAGTIDASLTPTDFLTFISPDIYGTETGYPKTNTYFKSKEGGYNITYAYVGLFSLVLVLFAFIHKRSKYFWSFFSIAAFCILFALGNYLPLYSLVQKIFPLMQSFRAPPKILFMYIFSMAILAGIGSEVLFEKITRNHRKSITIIKNILVIFLFASLIIFAAVLIKKDTIINYGERLVLEQYEQGNKLHSAEYYLIRVKLIYDLLLRNILFVSFLLLCSIFMIIGRLMIKDKKTNEQKQKSKLNYLRTLLVLLLVVDVFFYTMPKLEYVKNPEDVFAKNDLISFLEKDKTNFRIIDNARSLEQDLSVRSGLYLVGGYDSVIFEDYRNFVDLLTEREENYKDPNSLELGNIDFSEIRNYNVLNLLNVKYILTEQKLEDENLELAYNTTVYIDRLDIYRNINVYENKNVLPRAFVVRNAKVLYNEYNVLEEIKELNPENTVIIDGDYKTSEIQLKNEGEFKEAEITLYSPNRIKIDVSLETPGFLVLLDKYHPGWKAYDNGREIEVMKADGIFRAVYLEKGYHIVEFVYTPLMYKIGKTITLLTCLALVVYFSMIYIGKSGKDEKRNRK